MEVEETHHFHKKDSFTDRFRKNPWVLSTLILGVLTLILLVGNFAGFTGGAGVGKVISGEAVGEKLLSFYEASGAEGLSLDSVEEISGVYQVNFGFEGSVVPIFATKDGKYAGSLNILPDSTTSNEPSPQNMVKSDKPVVELFVMTHCPYGTQAEKGFLPAIEALGDTIDAKVRFVHYFLHDPEYTETPTQICIREEQGDKFDSYLECFLEDGDSARCLTETGIDKTKLADCEANKYEGYYAIDSELSQGYGVQGSPTLVVNGAIVSSSRDSASYLDTICGSFNNAPEECELELSSAGPSPGFGWETSSSTTTASC